MSILVPIAIYGWIPLVMVMFMVLKPRIAVATAFAAGWCFLPVAGFKLAGLPDINKSSVTSLGALLGTMIFHTWVLARFRPKLIDLPMLVWCVCPLFSSLSNNLGLYDGITGIVDRSMDWGLPYLIGRLHFRRLEHLHDLAKPIIVCTLIYVPLCLYEVRMSPQLNQKLYGFFAHGFTQHVRYEGFRPIVFMRHGLQVAMWLTTGLVLAAGLWAFGRQKRFTLFHIAVPFAPLVASIGVTLVLCKALGAVVLAGAGLGAMTASRITRSPLPILALSAVCVFYIGGRATDLWTGESAVAVAGMINEERSRSLQFRLNNETLLADKAREQVIFGWGGWGRNRVYDDAGNDLTTVDGLWIFVFGTNGLVGLVSLYTALLLGPTLLAARINPRLWRTDPDAALGSALAVVCILAAADSLPNAMTIPVVTMAMGAATGVCGSARGSHRRRSEWHDDFAVAA
ncbi:MAG: O-antigen ligase domain-containing protein [Phycisphaerales bacterium]